MQPEDAPPCIPVVGEIKRHVIESSDIDYVQPGKFYSDYLDEEGKQNRHTLYLKDININYETKKKVKYN